jgi:hypothetical protein
MNSFDYEQYLLNYPELKGFTKEMAQRHFKRCGQFEGRTDQIGNKKFTITVITPCCRPQNLLNLVCSLNFDQISEWIIVYDSSKVTCTKKQFEYNSKITEYFYTSEGISGNPQRNYALSVVNNKESYIYFLDDDNLIHPELYKLSLLPNKIYTFDQEEKNKLRLLGNKIAVGKIDSAMFLIWYPLIKETTFKIDKYDADGHFITECYGNNKEKLIYIPKIMCYYNVLAS